MNTLKELVDYCTTPVSMGALMFTGGWGSGKTYFLENDLKNALKDTHVFLRVSLYTLKSIDLVNEEIKRQWLYAANPFFNSLVKHEAELKKGKEMLENSMDAISAVQPTAKGVRALATVSESVLAFLPIHPQIKTKDGMREVVLIFDDLERTRLDMADVMGCINDYCENQHFKAIVVAHEGKIGSMDGGVSRPGMGMSMAAGGRNSQKIYYSLKEKTIARTICYKPDSGRIIHSILSESGLFDEKYRKHLLKHESLIANVCSVFSVRIDEAPVDDRESQDNARVYSGDNFRVLKYALHDFERIYHYLDARDLVDAEYYLYHFLVYTVADRIGLITRDQNGYLKSDEMVRKLCPQFNDRYMPDAIKNWILYGEWDDEDILKEEWLLYQKKGQITPQERLRTMSVLEWEETDIPDGYAALLQDGYEGELTVSEYVTLIHNARHIREMGLRMPQDIDWQRMLAGIRQCLKNRKEDKIGLFSYRKLAPEKQERYSPEELAAYDLIECHCEEKVVEMESAQKRFLRLIAEQGIRAFRLCKGAACGFDAEMARASAKCFDESRQSVKMRFPVLFLDCFGECLRQDGVDPAPSREGLRVLISEMETLKERYRQEDRFIAQRHADTMIKAVQSLMEAADKKTAEAPETKNDGKPFLKRQKPEFLQEVTETLKRKVDDR